MKLEQTSETYRAGKSDVKDSTSWEQTEKNKTMTQVVEFVTENSYTFTGNVFIADYQHRVETEMTYKLQNDQCLAVMDFLENIALQPQHEIESQTGYVHRIQFTLFNTHQEVPKIKQ